MELLNAEAILLDVFDLQEYDRVVVFLTVEHGKRRGVAPGSRRKYSQFGGQLQPLAKVKVSWAEKENRDLVRLSAVELIRPAEGLYKDLEGILVGSYLAEHMKEFAQENENGEHLFRLLDSTTEALLSGVDHQLAARYFESWMLRLAGIFPDLDECPSCGKSMLEIGAKMPTKSDSPLCSECAAPLAGTPVPFQALQLLQQFRHEPLSKLSNDTIDRIALGGAEALSAHVRRYFLDNELRSYRVMQEALAETKTF